MPKPRKIKTFEQFRAVFGDIDIDVMDLKGNRVTDYNNKEIAKIFYFEDCLTTVYVRS